KPLLPLSALSDAALLTPSLLPEGSFGCLPVSLDGCIPEREGVPTPFACCSLPSKRTGNSRQQGFHRGPLQILCLFARFYSYIISYPRTGCQSHLDVGRNPLRQSSSEGFQSRTAGQSPLDSDVSRKAASV